jgi:hypothetical protein
LRLEAAGDWVLAVPQVKSCGEEGFSLLIKEPGIYKLKGYPLILRCLSDREGTSGLGSSFRAELPLVLRPSRPDDRTGGVNGVSWRKAIDRARSSVYTDSITVEDCRGIAAFIGIGRGRAAVIADRNGSDSARGGNFFFFVLNEGPQADKRLGILF